VLPKTTGSAQTRKSMSFTWIVWSTLYVYLCLSRAVNEDWQLWHRYGRSPVWRNMWRTRELLWRKLRGQCSQKWFFSSAWICNWRNVLCTLLFYQIEPYKKGPFLFLLSSIARNSSAPSAKRFFQIHRGIIEGCSNRARPSQPYLKKFPKWHPCMEFEIFLGQMSSFNAL
jgi:hypothetical protein